MVADRISAQVDVDVHSPAVDAYNSFKSQFEQLQQCPGTRDRAQTGAGLPESQLDKLSLVWLAQQNSSLGRDITRADIEAPQATQFDALMAAHAAKQYEAVKSAHFDSQGGWHFAKDKDAITSKDIDVSLQTVEKQRQAMDYADPLMKDNGLLFSVLSKNHDGVRSVNYWDLKEARKIDDYEHSKGTALFTDEQRAVIDQMYHDWSTGTMRAVEDRPQGSNMGCDGEITMDSLTKGTGFANTDEMKSTFNQPLQLITEAEYCRDTVAQRQHDVLRQARQMWHQAESAINAQAHYSVKDGQGFDRIARDVMKKEGGGATPAEKDVETYSQDIAQMNGYDRDSYDPKMKPLKPGASVQVHDDQWQLGRKMDAVAEIDDWVKDNVDQK